MKRHLLIAVLLLALSACAQYSLVEAKKQEIGGAYTVEAQIAWNKSSEGKLEIWTVDGPSLNAVRFFKGLGDGDALFKIPRKTKEEAKLPTYRSGMTPNDVMDLVADSVARIGANDVQTRNLRPIDFGGNPGFRFEVTFYSSDGLELDGLVAGAIVEEKLHMIMYTGARLHYFPKYKEDVERLIGSVEMI
ncbi:MAG: hypothetical protein V3T80_00195 [Kiloniellales bacterium]|jgi:hypothetical protein